MNNSFSGSRSEADEACWGLIQIKSLCGGNQTISEIFEMHLINKESDLQ